MSFGLRECSFFAKGCALIRSSGPDYSGVGSFFSQRRSLLVFHGPLATATRPPTNKHEQLYKRTMQSYTSRRATAERATPPPASTSGSSHHSENGAYRPCKVL